jgi:hypothetical protein
LSRSTSKVRTMTSRQQQELRSIGVMLEGVAAIWCQRSARLPQLWSTTHEDSETFNGRLRRRLAVRHDTRIDRAVLVRALAGKSHAF